MVKTLLIVLPYAGLVLTGVSAIWGLNHELYTKDANNKRHLTQAGRYAIAFTLLGMVISLNTAVLKNVTDNQARNEAAQKEQQKALDELTRQQQEEARARRQEEHLTQVKQEQRDNALAQQGRDLSMAQQQLAGFNRGERLARQQMMEELERSNRVLFNVNRGQYPLTVELRITPTVKISTKHPIFKDHLLKIQNEAQKLGVDKVDVAENSPLLPPDKSLARSYLTSRLFHFAFYRKGRADVLKAAPDLVFAYNGEVLGTENKWYRPLTYKASDGSFTTVGPTATPFDITHSTGKVISYLDLPGSTLVISCSDVKEVNGLPAVAPSCNENMRFESIYLTTPIGVELEIPGSRLTPRTVGGMTYLVHTFDSNVERFFEIYAKRS
ncbi:MAG TPA: hypothetical protein VFX97_04010 [Pyrinomonadaceae bacterium]|nr:hypothetical protein [Pyrinomonadaceae bacterium]